MAIKNIVEDIIVPSVPKTIDNEQIHVYVPLANYNNPGIVKIEKNSPIGLDGAGYLTINDAGQDSNHKGVASFDKNFFKIKDGHVKLDYASYDTYGVSSFDRNYFKVDNGRVTWNGALEVGSIATDEGINSLIQRSSYASLNNRALTMNSVAIGTNNIAGLKGYWFNAINFVTKEIRIDPIGTIDSINLRCLPTIYDSEYGLQPYHINLQTGWEIGDYIHIRIPQMHYVFRAKISTLNGDVIGYDVDFTNGEGFKIIEPEGGITALENFDLYTVAVPSKPFAGIIPVAFSNYAEGNSNICTGIFGHSEGCKNLTAGGYGHTEGFDTWAGYAAHAQNAHTRALAMYSTATGFNTKVEGKDNGAAFGIDTYVNAYAGFGTGGKCQIYGDYSFGCGFKNTITEDGLHSFVGGNNCEVSARSGFAHGDNCKCYGMYGFAGGNNVVIYNTAKSSRSFGENNGVYAPYSGCDGINNVVSNSATGSLTSGIENYNNGKASYVGGESCNVYNQWQFAHGQSLNASESRIAQVLFGRYNVVNDDAVFQVGNGVTDAARSNAFQVVSTRTGGNNYVSLVVGKTTITEQQLRSLLALI